MANLKNKSSSGYLGLGLGVAGSMFDFLNRPGYKGQPPPKDIMLSDADIKSLKAGTVDETVAGSAKAIEDIKGFGAANRLPEGAVLSGIGQTTENIGKSLSTLTPKLKEVQRRSKMDYYNLYQQYLNNKFQTELGYHNRDMGGLGALSKVAMLFSNGLI